MPYRDSSHVQISRLWRHSRELYPDVLTTAEWHHLMRCEDCVILLQVCYKSQSIDDAQKGLKNFGLERNLEDCKRQRYSG
jgi:hypothetical protein